MHYMGPPNFSQYERERNKDRLTLRTVAPRTLRFLGRFAGRLFGREPEPPKPQEGFEVVAKPLHYTSTEAGAAEDAGEGLSTDNKLEMMRTTEKPQDPNRN